jgi:hypothetical protein
VPEQLLTSSGTNIVMPQASTLSQRQERLERYKDSFDLDIFEQVHYFMLTFLNKYQFHSMLLSLQVFATI